MATVTRTYKTDDIDGSEEDVSTVRLGLDKQDYEIDLSAANEARLREKLAKYVEAGKRVTLKPNPHRGRKTVKAEPVGREQSHAIRVWAKSQGLEVSERGRISKSVQEAFDAAH